MGYVHHQYGIVSLGCSWNHVRNEVLVSRRVKEHNLPAIQLHLLDSDIDSHSSLPLFIRRVSDPGEFKRLLANLFRFLLILVYLLLGEEVDLMQEHAHQSRLAWIYMTYNHNIYSFGRLNTLFDLNRRVLLVVVLSVVVFNNVWVLPYTA